MSISIIERDSRGRGSISLYFRVAEAALSFSASPVDDIDQYEGRRSVGAVEYPWEGEPCPNACDPTSDSLASLSVLQIPAHDIVDQHFPEWIGLTCSTAFRPIYLPRPHRLCDPLA
jgi:hypothetical protein